MEQYTNQQFIDEFGMTPEEYKLQFPTRVKAATPKKVLPEIDYGTEKMSGPSLEVQQERADLTDKRVDLVTKNQTSDAAKKAVEEMVRSKEGSSHRVADNTEEFTRNALSGIGQIPTEPLALISMLGAMGPALISGTLSEEDKPVYKRILDEFTNNILPPEKQEPLHEYTLERLTQAKEQYPELTSAQEQQILEQIVNTEGFQNKLLEQMPTGIQIALKNNNFMNKVFGVDKRSDQQTMGDDVQQLIGQSVIALPSTAVKIPRLLLTRAVGEKVMNNLITRSAIRAAELATPITIPGTPAAIGGNIAVGTGMIEGMRYATDTPSILNGAAQLTEEQYEDAVLLENLDPSKETFELAKGVGVAIFGVMGAAGVRKVLKNKILSADEQRVDKIDFNKGETLADQSDALKPLINDPTVGTIDGNAPIKKGMQQFVDPDDVDSISLADAELSAASTVNIVEAENRAVNYGILENSENTVPFKEIDRSVDALRPEEKELLDKYVYAIQRSQDKSIRSKDLDDQLSAVDTEIQVARNQLDNSKATRLNKQRSEILNSQKRLVADAPSSRSSFEGVSDADFAAVKRVAEQNPKIVQIAEGLKKVSQDIAKYKYKNGLMNSEEYIQQINSRPLYVPLQERQYPEVTNRLKRQALILRDNLFKGEDRGRGLASSNKARNLDEREGGKVNIAKSAHISAKEAMLQAIREVSANNARKKVIDLMDNLPNARNKLLRPYEFNVGGKKLTSVTTAQYSSRASTGKAGGSYADVIENSSRNYVKITRDGRVEAWEMSDKSMAKALEFAPLAVIPIFNGIRKIWQAATTGLMAPWFAVKSGMFWEPLIAKTTSMQGRSLGIIDTQLRRLTQGTALETSANILADQVFDPTAFLSTWAAIPRSIYLRSTKALADKVTSDLKQNSGLFNELAKNPMMNKLIDEGAQAAIRQYDNTAYSIQFQHLSSSLSHLNDASAIADDYAKAAAKAAGPLATMLTMYKAVIESVQQSTKTAFFAQNYWTLHAKHKGNIPKKELTKLVQETRNLTGDMSRTSNNKTIQRTTSVVPYGNAILQGTRHMLAATIPPSVAKSVNAAGGNMITQRSNKFWGQMISGVLLPKLVGLYAMSQWEGAEDWWYNKTPTWQRLTNIPMPSPAALEYRATNGQWPAFDPAHMNMVPLAPEFTLILGPAEAMMKTMGLFNSPEDKYGNTKSDILDVLAEAGGIATPPLFQMLAAFNGTRFDVQELLLGQGVREFADTPHGGANGDNMTLNSDIVRTVSDMAGALLGTAGLIAAQGLNVFDISMDENNDFMTALEDATDTVAFEAKRRLPNIDVPGFISGVDRSYAFNRESRYVYQTQEDLSPIIGSGRQATIERDSKDINAAKEAAGLEVAQKIKDPVLKGLTEVVWDTLKKKGPYKTAGEEYTKARSYLASLEATKFRIPDTEYNAKRNKYIQYQQKQRTIQAEELRSLNTLVIQKLGPAFKQRFGTEFSYKAFSEAVRKDVGN